MSNCSVNTIKVQSSSCSPYAKWEEEAKLHRRRSQKTFREATFVRPCTRIDWCQNETLDWISHEDRYAHIDKRVCVHAQAESRRRYQSAPEGRSRSGGWKRIKLSVINNAVWSPRSSFYAGTVAHTHVSQGRRSSPRLAMTRLITPRRR